jgi:hypothetical protein
MRVAVLDGDLDDGMEVTRAVHAHHGLATFDQLAKALEHETVESGAFRTKLTTARVFGFVDIEGERVSLTDIGNEAVRPETEGRAKAQAFLRVPLYQAIYEKYKGRLLPGNTVLEADMEALGVAPKQKGRARQGFQRSAEQAKLGKDRLVLPAGVSLDSKTSNGEKGRKVDTVIHAEPSAELSPALLALFDMLPAPGSEWSAEKREEWMRFAAAMFNRLYKDKPT